MKNTNEMNKTLNLHRNIITFGIPISILLVLILVMKSTVLSGNDTLILAISADLLLTVPLVYFLLIRKTTIPKTTIFPVMIAGLLIGSYFMPQEGQRYLSLFKTWALPLIELSILTFVVSKVRMAIKKYKAIKGLDPDFFDTLKETCYEILPKGLVVLVVTEIAVVYYGFINWTKREITENEFTYHKKSGTQALFGALILIIGVETFAFHFLLAKWSIVAAWVLTALSIYTAIQFFGFAKSLSQRPISVNSNSLTLRYGILNEVEIPFSDIVKIEISRKPLDMNVSTKKLSPLGELESHNVIIHLNKENKMVGLYGRKKCFKVLGFYVDTPEIFLDKVVKILPPEV